MKQVVKRIEHRKQYVDAMLKLKRAELEELEVLAIIVKAVPKSRHDVLKRMLTPYLSR